MAGRVENKVALVTGGGSGIGRATALLFAREGAEVLDENVVEIDRGGNQLAVYRDVAGRARTAALGAAKHRRAVLRECRAVVSRAPQALFGEVGLIQNRFERPALKPLPSASKMCAGEKELSTAIVENARGRNCPPTSSSRQGRWTCTAPVHSRCRLRCCLLRSPPMSQHVRLPSARSNQLYRARLIKRYLVFTNRCCSIATFVVRAQVVCWRSCRRR
jgi:hypothetical protein